MRGDVRDEKLIQKLIKKNDVFALWLHMLGLHFVKNFLKKLKISYKAVEFMCIIKRSKSFDTVTNSGYGIGEKDKFVMKLLL